MKRAIRIRNHVAAFSRQREKLIACAFVLLASLILNSKILAQDTISPRTRTSQQSTGDQINQSRSNRESLSDALLKAQESLRQLSSNQPATTAQPRSSLLQQEDTTDRPTATSNKKLEQLRRRLDLLNQSFAEEQAKQPETPDPQSQSNETETMPGQESKTIPDTSELILNNQDPLPNEFENPENEQPVPLPSNGQKITGVIDAFELANSMFQTGNVEGALKIYKKIEGESRDPIDQQWLEFFMASSLRITADRDAAKQYYRNAMSHNTSSKPAIIADLWMNHIDRVGKSAYAYEQIEAEIDAIIKELGKDE
ncbi:MAG: hypothetical protein R3C03_15605 [Pirellulaceae bacterium]